jgi:hypothetical protein
MLGGKVNKHDVPEPIEEVGVKWVIGPNVRADILGYAGVDITGAQFIAQIYASGFRRGTLEGLRLKSIVIGAPYGTRITLCATTDEVNWEDAPWRTIRILEGQTYHTGEGVPAVRVPDIDWLDGFDQRRTNTKHQQSYPLAKKLVDGTAWTFGTGASLHNRVRMIRVEREDRPISAEGAIVGTTATAPGESASPASATSLGATPVVAPTPAPIPPPSIANVAGSEDQWRLPVKK